MQHQDIVASLRAEFLQAIGEIKALKEGNSSLKEQVEQLQEQVKVGEVLLQKETKKRRRRFRAYLDCMEQLTVYQARCETLEASLHQEPAQPETSREVELEQENQALKEEVNLLKTGQRKLEDELKKKDELLQTTPYLNSPATLTVKEKEVNKSQAKMQEATLRQETTLTEGVSSGKMEAVEKENKNLKKQADKLIDELKNLQEDVRRKEELVKVGEVLLKKETKKRHGRFRAYLDCMEQLTMYQAKCETMEASLHQEPAQPETSRSREMEVDQENQALKKQVDKLTAEQKNLQDEVRRKEELVKKEIRKRQASTRSYLDCLSKLSDMENELENVERIYGWKR